MVETAKNHAQLDYEKLESIQHTLLKIGLEIQKSLDKYRNPKELASKAIRGYNSDVTAAAIFLSLFSANIKTGQKLTPEQISEKLPKSFVLKPRQRTEALRKVQKEGFLANVKGQDKRRGRPKTEENIIHKRKGGPHSYYVITEGLGELKKLMSDSDATQLIHDHLKKVGIIQKYYKLLISASFYAIKKENKTKGKLFELVKASTPLYISQISEDDFSAWDNFVNPLRSKDDEELNSLAESYAHIMAERSPFDDFVYLLKIVKNYRE